jgi:hypothetical protein
VIIRNLTWASSSIQWLRPRYPQTTADQLIFNASIELLCAQEISVPSISIELPTDLELASVVREEVIVHQNNGGVKE